MAQGRVLRIAALPVFLKTYIDRLTFSFTDYLRNEKDSSTELHQWIRQQLFQLSRARAEPDAAAVVSALPSPPALRERRDAYADAVDCEHALSAVPLTADYALRDRRSPRTGRR